MKRIFLIMMLLNLSFLTDVSASEELNIDDDYLEVGPDGQVIEKNPPQIFLERDEVAQTDDSNRESKDSTTETDNTKKAKDLQELTHLTLELSQKHQSEILTQPHHETSAVLTGIVVCGIVILVSKIFVLSSNKS